MQRVSCLLPTYRRCRDSLWVLSEAVECFLRQDLPCQKELIVCNDEKAETLVCDAPGVQVFNVLERFASLGAKMNFMASKATGSILFRWDDDDISLPHRLRYSIEAMGSADAWMPRGRFTYTTTGLQYRQHCTICMGVFRRSLFDRMGGWPNVSDKEDQLAWSMMQKAGNCLRSVVPPAEAFFIYRWNGKTGPHMSSQGAGSWESSERRRPVAPGEHRIVPAWREDYCELSRLASKQ